MTRFFYLHGFNSGFDPSIAKIKSFESIAPVEGRTTDYLDDNDVQALTRAVEISKELPGELILVGTSLGGYFARYLSKKFNLRCILLNPALTPFASLQRAEGSQTNYLTGKIKNVTREAVVGLAKYAVNNTSDCLTILATDDEVIDHTFAQRLLCESSKIILTDGGHRMNDVNKMLGEIQLFVNNVPANDNSELQDISN
jgi:predicted esterase YcpF (UPF0227 family)